MNKSIMLKTHDDAPLSFYAAASRRGFRRPKAYLLTQKGGTSLDRVAVMSVEIVAGQPRPTAPRASEKTASVHTVAQLIDCEDLRDEPGDAESRSRYLAENQWAARFFSSSCAGLSSSLNAAIRSHLQEDPVALYLDFIEGFRTWIEESRRTSIRRFALLTGSESPHEHWFVTPDDDPAEDRGVENQLQTGTSTDSLWRVLSDANAPLDDRVATLHELISVDPEQVARLVVDELERPDISAPWRNALILTAETLQFDDQRLRERVMKTLYRLASELRHSTEPGIKPIVQSAIRCYASMIPVTEANTLKTFLEPPHPVETRLVTLQCIANLFESRPPECPEKLQPLADRIYELADKFLDRDWLVPGEKAAIGQNAAFALAAIGDPRLSQCVERVRQLQVSWLTRQLERKLSRLLHGWSTEQDISNHSAVECLERLLPSLKDHGTCH